MMKRWVAALVVFFGAILTSVAAQSGALQFSVELVCGTSDAVPPRHDAHPASHALTQHLQMFKWQNYWELRKETVSIAPGAKVRLHLTPDREVELIRGAHDLTISIFHNGKLTRRRDEPIDKLFYIAGGDKENAQSWFVVVQREGSHDTRRG